MPAKRDRRRIRMANGLPWIPLAVDFPESRKAIALGIALQEPLAWAYVVRLWTWAARQAQEGRIEGPDAVAALEHAAGWKGAPGELVRALSLPHIRLVDELTTGFAIHDWSEHCGAHVEKREKDRDRMRRLRSANGTRTEREQSRNCPRPSTSPSPSPSPSPSRSSGSDGRTSTVPPQAEFASDLEAEAAPVLPPRPAGVPSRSVAVRLKGCSREDT